MATAQPTRRSDSETISASSLTLGGDERRPEHQDGTSTPLAKDRLPPLARGRGERRSEARYDTDQPAVLTEINPLTFGSTPVRVRDVSRSGLKIYLSHLLYPGAMVHIRSRKIVVTAEVRYCVQSTGGYVAGMAILDVLPFDGLTRLSNEI